MTEPLRLIARRPGAPAFGTRQLFQQEAAKDRAARAKRHWREIEPLTEFRVVPADAPMPGALSTQPGA